MSLSNYPPGHPTGISRGELGQVFYCEPCNMLIEPDDLNAAKLRLQLKHKRQTTCPDCDKPIEPALCDCGQPATHIDVDKAVNAAEAFCSRHGM
jgi:hypothetical protein